MGEDIILGQYLPGNSIIHRLDPRTKIILTTLLMLVAFFIKGWWGFAIFGALLASLAAAGRIPFGYLYRGMKPMITFAIITFLFQVFFEGGGKELFHWGIFRVTDQGLVLAVYMSLRLLLVILIVLVMTLTTSPMELSEGVERLFRPMNRFGMNSYELALVASGALRFVPTLLEQGDKVKRAQMARGVNFEEGNIWVRAKKMLPLLAPLFLNSVRRAEDLGMAMEARCYQGGMGRISRRQSSVKAVDYIAYLFSVTFVVLLLGYRL